MKHLILALGLFSSSSILAQNVNPDVITNIGDSIPLKKEVVVYGKGLPENFSNRSSSIQIISMVQNKDMPIRSVNEALLFVPGLDLRQRGGQGIQGDLSIRGGTFEQNLILINGFKLVDPQTGHHALNLPVLLTNVQSIELYKGSATRIFGQNAMTGAVNFVTQVTKKYGFNMQVFAGDFGGVGTQATVSAPIGKLNQSFSMGYDKSNGHWYNSDHVNQQYFYDATLPVGKKQEVRALVGYTDRSFGANGYYTSAFPDQWESTQMGLAGLSHQISLKKLKFLTKASLRTHRDEFRLKRFDPAFYTNKHWSEVMTLEETGQYNSRTGTTGFGAEYRQEGLKSSNLGERDRTYFSGFIDHKLTFLNQKLVIVGNAHYFNLGMNGNVYQKVLPGFEVSLMPIKSLKIFGNISQSYRAPSYTELFYQDPSNVGNPDLQPEYATNAELGVSFSRANLSELNSMEKSRITVDVTLYRRNTSNMIDWLRTTNAMLNPWKPVNLSSVIFTGIESNVSYRWNGNGVIMIRELSLGYNYLDASHQFTDALGQSESRYAFSGLRNQLIGRLTMNLTHWVNFTVAYRGIDRVGGNTYSLMDAKIKVNPTRNLSMFLEGNNLFNTEYIEAGYVQMPGRWFKLGMSISFSE